jgi:molybdopterin molybdotransferase
MRSVAEHQQRVAQLITPPDPVAVPLAAARRRVLATDIAAGVALPPFDNSAMDGYAVRAVDIAAATEANPVVLPVESDIPAGRVDIEPLRAGTAHRIMTGAPVPPGADAVVEVEATDGGVSSVAVRAARPVGRHVRRAGEDIEVGDPALAAGTVLGATQIGLLAALGHGAVPVRPALRVLVLSTGSELVAAGRPLRPGQIYESNSPMLAAAIDASGARAEVIPFVRDDGAGFHAALDARLAEVDVIVTSGGVSAGAYEVVKEALVDEDVEFARVAMQPGMPQGAGRYRGVPIVTFPGNPVSALVSFEVFLRPALRTAMGYPDPQRPVVTARLATAIDSSPGRRQFRRGRLDRGHGTVAVVGPPGSHFLHSLADADCLFDVGADVTHLDAGTEVEVWLTTD